MTCILLIHHEPALRGHLAGVLAAAGHAVVTVDRGTRALPLLADACFDLLLADIVTPGMAGAELAQRCAELSPATRVMFITGFTAVAIDMPGCAPQPRAASRPFHLRRLAAEVERLFPVAAGAAAAASRLQAREQAGKGTALPGEPG